VISAVKTTTRSADRLAKVSRTIADLADAEEVGVDHINEATSLMISFQGA
jgi:predicted ATPase with chaperone activity